MNLNFTNLMLLYGLAVALPILTLILVLTLTIKSFYFKQLESNKSFYDRESKHQKDNYANVMQFLERINNNLKESNLTLEKEKEDLLSEVASLKEEIKLLNKKLYSQFNEKKSK